jgi:hypothetical protein
LSSEFECVQGGEYGTCISLDWKCDGYNDCTGNTDETGCVPSTVIGAGGIVGGTSCSAGFFFCQNPYTATNCVSNAWLCDGINDCFDGSDEGASCSSTLVTDAPVANSATDAPATTIKIPNGTPSTCAELGWGKVVNGVCGESDKGLGVGGTDQCKTASQADASAVCSAAGARLCTTTEIDSLVASQTGCGYDSEFVWTSTWCGFNGKVYASLGDGSGDRRCKNKKRELPVRCCADETLAVKTTAATTTTTMKSFVRRTCAELGWAATSGTSVCGESDKAFKPSDSSDKCYNWRNQPDAEKVCVKIGARLCTTNEAITGVGKSTGCSMDKEFVWTSTLCNGGYTRVKANDGTTECVPTTAKGPVRCCSDTSVFRRASYSEVASAVKKGKTAAKLSASSVSQTDTPADDSSLVGGIFAAFAVALVAAVVTARRQTQRNGFQEVASVEPAALDKSIHTTSIRCNGPGTPPKEPSRMTTEGSVYSL